VSSFAIFQRRLFLFQKFIYFGLSLIELVLTGGFDAILVQLHFNAVHSRQNNGSIVSSPGYSFKTRIKLLIR